MPQKVLQVVVVGGGIGGLCLAQGLRKAGIQVKVFERDRTVDARLDRYRLHINPAGTRAMRACLPDAMWDRFLADSVAQEFSPAVLWRAPSAP